MYRYYVNIKTRYIFYIVLLCWCDCISSIIATDENLVNGTVLQQTHTDNLNQYCWNDGNMCSIIGNFTRQQISLSIAVNINCLNIQNNATDPMPKGLQPVGLLQRFHRIEIIHLNGCGVNDQQRNSFGIEHIPDQANVLQLTLEMFKIDRPLRNDTFAGLKQLKSLALVNNLLLSGLNRTTLSHLVQLNELVIEKNQLTTLDAHAFDDFASTLTDLTIREDALILNSIAPLQQVKHAHLNVKQLNWSELFKSLRGLETLTIEHTLFVINVSDNVLPNFEHLIEMHLVFNDLDDIPFNQYPNLQRLNISHNRMDKPSFEKNNLIVLKEIDVSYNNLTLVDEQLLATLLHLERFVAHHNRISVIKRKAFNRNLYMRHIDISHNELKVLNLDLAIFTVATQLQIYIDENPWSCVWVINFSANEPHIFNMKFVYTKTNDRINMRGLKCRFYANDEMILQHHYHMVDDTQLHHNHSGAMPMLPTLPPGMSKKRNTKHSAAITIVILVVGVTTLSVLLYLHIKCRPNATSLQSPFYRTLPTNHCSSSDRADIVRRILPPTDYESPLSLRMDSGNGINGLGHDGDDDDDMKPDATIFNNDIDSKALYEEIPDTIDVDCMHLDLNDFSYRLTMHEHEHR